VEVEVGKVSDGGWDALKSADERKMDGPLGVATELGKGIHAHCPV
jgi:hypothetical protein